MVAENPTKILNPAFSDSSLGHVPKGAWSRKALLARGFVFRAGITSQLFWIMEKSSNRFSSLDAQKYLLSLVTEHGKSSTSIALFSWKSIVFPSIVFLSLLRVGDGGWTPFVASVLALAFVQRNIAKGVINDTIEHNSAENPSHGIFGTLGAHCDIPSLRSLL